jgi:hypothetical protein
MSSILIGFGAILSGSLAVVFKLKILTASARSLRPCSTQAVIQSWRPLSSGLKLDRLCGASACLGGRSRLNQFPQNPSRIDFAYSWTKSLMMRKLGCPSDLQILSLSACNADDHGHDFPILPGQRELSQLRFSRFSYVCRGLAALCQSDHFDLASILR